MKEVKRKIFRMFFLLEIIIFSLVYFFGSHGIHAIWQVQKDNKLLECQIKVTELEVQDLAKQIEDWKSDSFYKEQLAREQLQMAKRDEKIFLI